MIKNPLISVVMPIYNVEHYLKDAIDSVINQSIGFEENIELILINDGSPDGCELICLDYKKRFPQNIVYIKQKNQGLSASRRNGFLKARGEYVHSMDSDDTISTNYYQGIVDFFRNHIDEVDMVASKLILFEAKSGGHYLNYRFKKTRVVRIDEEPKAFQYHISSVVIRRKAIKSEWFDEKISIGEDARLIAIILRKKRAYGVVSNVTYNYRIRESGNSLINTQHNKIDYYTETPKRFWQETLNAWKGKDGKITPYVQNLILNDIQWRLNGQTEQAVLSKKEERKYKDVVYGTIFQLDDRTILGADRLDFHKKLHLLKQKYGAKFDELVTESAQGYVLNQKDVIVPKGEYGSTFALVFDFIHMQDDGRLRIEGYPENDTIHSGDQIFIRTSKGDFELVYVDRAQRRRDAFLGDTFRKHEAFEIEIEIDKEDVVSAVFKSFSGQETEIPIHTRRHTKLSSLSYSYHRERGRLLRRNKDKIYIHKYTLGQHVRFELTFMLRILTNISLSRVRTTTEELLRSIRDYDIDPSSRKEILITALGLPVLAPVNILRNFRSIFTRLLYYTGFGSKKKPIWIISDRGTAAGDNGEAFFRYLSANNVNQVNYYFAISKKSKDYKRLKRIGPVVDREGLKYKLLFLKSSKIISSHADEYVINPFGPSYLHLLDLFEFDFVFLQHGVTKNNISNWLNRFNKNINPFITVSKKEQDSILEYPFYYQKDKVALTGFPRHDLLDSDTRRKVILAPTWRKYLTIGSAGKVGKWDYSDGFKESDYYNFYNRFINDQRVLNALKDENVTGEFYLHPSHAVHTKDFEGNELFKVMSFPYDYKTAFKEGNLLITDYSSVYFDFSYLYKPVIYTQFDRDYYYQNHGVYDRGYFDERRDGFGPVVEDYEAAIEATVHAIKSGFPLHQKYRTRIDEFFMYHDHNSSQRVFEILTQSE